MPARCFYQNEHGIAYLNTGVAGQNVFIIKGAPLRLRRSNPSLAGPRGERMGKGARYDAAASIAWPLPLNQDGALHYLV